MTKKDLILESTTLWDYPIQNYGDKPHGNNKYNGVTLKTILVKYHLKITPLSLYLLIPLTRTI